MMKNVVLHCPSLGRSIEPFVKAVGDLEIHIGQRTADGEIGCREGHKSIVAKAAVDELDYVFVMEDDCEFTEHFNYKKWIQDAEWAQSKGYDIMVGGSVQVYHPKIVRDGMVEASAFHSAHCIVYFRSGYQKVLEAEGPHYDLSLGLSGCRVVLTYPFVAVQKPGYSGLQNNNVNYVPLYERYEDLLGAELGWRVVVSPAR